VADLGAYLDRLTKKQLIIAVTALALDKGVDLATGGALNKMTKKAVQKVIHIANLDSHLSLLV